MVAMSGMDMSGMDMSGTSSGTGLPALEEFPKIYWALVGATIAVATTVNAINIIICRQRLSAARNGSSTPAKPKNIFFEANATATALVREAASATLDPIQIWKLNVPMPQVGKLFFVLANLVVLLALSFVGFPNSATTKDPSELENIAYRLGFVCLAQLPLLFLLAGKNNVIGFLTGMSYEKLNWMHRWMARTLFLFATIHFGYWLKDWWPYGGYVTTQIRTNNLVYWGLTAWCLLAWIVFSSFAPVRRLSYEVFVVQHLVTFSLFIGFTYKHLQPFPSTHAYLWACVGIFFFDRLTRAFFVLYTNFSYFHPQQRRSGDMNAFWAGKAEFTPLPNNTTRITIKNPPISWNAGQHVFVSCHSVVPLQSHPFTIASIPQDGKMEFFVKSEKGGTKHFYAHAEKSSALPLMDGAASTQLRTVALEGPYGRIRPLRQFDSVVFFAGSTGATFTMPLLRDIVAGWRERDSQGTWLRPAGVVTRHVRFVWVVKSRGQASWFASHLFDVVASVEKLQAEGLEVDVEISVYCTCDDSFTEEQKSLLSSLAGPSAPREKIIVGHGPVEEIDEVTQEKPETEKKEDSSVREVSSDEPRHSNAHACGGGSCCCQSTIEDEAEIASNPNQPCCCCCSSSSDNGGGQVVNVKSASSSSNSLRKKPLLPASVSLLNGRPSPRNIIRKSLEQAMGESAVVVCGPQGLVASVRGSVVTLSDERAVHKGTGAQGIYLHCEAFTY